MPYMVPSDNLIWGRLVKSWSTGNDYLKDPTTVPTAKPLPTGIKNSGTMSDTAFTDILKKVSAYAGTALTIPLPNGVTKVVFVQNTSDTVYINLPPANAIIAADAALIAGGTYALPDFEMALFGPPAPIRNGKPVTTSEKLDLTANYIGDYVVAQCAHT